MRFPSIRSFALWLPLAVSATVLAANTQISPDKPVINFSLPYFTPEGERAWLARGSEAFYLAKENQIDVKELTLTIFSGKNDGKLQTVILSPFAKIQPNESIVTSSSTLRVINDQFEATGLGWRYLHKDKKVIIEKKVRFSFHAEFTDFLK